MRVRVGVWVVGCARACVCLLACKHTAKNSVQLPDMIHELSFPRKCATHDVVVSSQVFRARREHQVGAKLDGPVVDGRAKCRVDAADAFVLLA